MAKSPPSKRLLITGATGKVGQNAIRRCLAHPFERFVVRAFCHHRRLEAGPRTIWYPG